MAFLGDQEQSDLLAAVPGLPDNGARIHVFGSDENGVGAKVSGRRQR